MSNFKKIYSTKATDITPVWKYQSEETGLNVVIADVEGPIVSAFICLATEAEDDDGLPHTLEHLIFLGSERFPYKGLLDLLANRCLASGTNAWTDVDHTAYSVHTAGASGLLAILPTYLDHILFPQLTDHAYITEVHHITGEGNDAGVVYCEMQGRENTAESRCYNKLMQMVYDGTGYAVETGGKLDNLRNSTNNQKVKDFHNKFYRPENITIIICGQVDHEEVFNSLKPLEDIILSKGTRKKFVRPWQSPVPPLQQSCVERLEYPTDSEDSGLVLIGWRGPVLHTEEGLVHFMACSVLLRYLCETPAAPLQKALTETESPYAGDVVNNLVENSPSLLYVSLENVPVEKIDGAVERCLSVVKDVCSGVEPLELSRLQRLLRLQRREALAYTETSPHQTITFMCIADMLHSQNHQQSEVRLNKQRILKDLEKENEEWWRKLAIQYLDGPHAVVKGAPSTKLMEQMAEEEQKRIMAQVEEFGPEGLKEKEQILTQAMDYNEREVPVEILRSVTVSECYDIRYHSMQTWDSQPSTEPCTLFQLDQMPFYTRLHNIQSHFVYMTLLADTGVLSSSDRQWLPLLCSLLMECPVWRGDQLLPHTALMTDMEEMLNEFSLTIGIKNSKRFAPGALGETFAIFAQCEPDRYEEVVKLMWEVMKKTELTKERMVVVAQRLVQEVATIRRNGERLVRDILKDINYVNESNVHICSVLRQQRFLKDVLKQLEGSEEQVKKVLESCNSARHLLFSPQNLWLQLVAHLDVHKLSAEPWKLFSHDQQSQCHVKNIKLDSALLCSSEERRGKGSVVGVGGVESCFLRQTSPGPLGLDHPQLPALMVAIQYFVQLEGPLWRQVRGAGLAYGYSILPVPSEGMLLLELYKATNPTLAFQKTLNIIKTFLDSGNWDEDLFASAKSSLVYEVVDEVKTPYLLIREALFSYCMGIPENYIKTLAGAVCQVSCSEALETAKEWLTQLLQPDYCTLSIVCHPTKVIDISQHFKRMGYKLDSYSSLEESNLNDV